MAASQTFKKTTKLASSNAAQKGPSKGGATCAQRIEYATVQRTQVSMTENMVQDAEALFNSHDSEGTALLSRGALTELLRQVGLEGVMSEAFGPTARLAFDAHSADSHFLSLAEFKQLYYVVNQRYPGLLPRPPFLKIWIYSAKGLPPADVNGKSDPFAVVQIPGKPSSKSQTRHMDKTLDPVWKEEFYDKYMYEKGDPLEFIVMDYDRGATDYELLGKGRLLSSDFHKPGGFEGDIQLKAPPEHKGLYNPTIRVKVIVVDVEKMKAREGIGRQSKLRGAAHMAARMMHKDEHHDEHDEHHHPQEGSKEGVKPKLAEKKE